MNRAELPTWVSSLDEEGLHLIRRFVLAGGSLKKPAADYGVTKGRVPK